MTTAGQWLAVAHDGAEVRTADGLAAAEALHPVQQAFIDHDAFQGGYCTPGQICSAVGMLQEAKRGWPSHVTADLAGVRSSPTPRHAGDIRRPLARNRENVMEEVPLPQVARPVMYHHCSPSRRSPPSAPASRT